VPSNVDELDDVGEVDDAQALVGHRPQAELLIGGVGLLEPSSPRST
jgi:hypothetical protein